MYAEKAIELFYLFFQGVLTFQSFFLGILYFITKKKDILFYTFFLLFTTLYFFFNAPNTFFGLNDNVFFSSAIYRYINIPLIIITNLFYLLFLKAFFTGIYNNRRLNELFGIIFLFIPVLTILFFVLRIRHIDTQSVFYTVNFLSTSISIYIITGVYRHKIKNTGWVALGMIFNILGTALTILMIVLERYQIYNILTVDYPLIFMRIGIMADMFFYLIALLKKWHTQEKELAVQQITKELEVANIRNRISSQLHDDIGSTLSGISMYSYMASTQLQQGNHANVQATLQTIQQSASEVVNKMGDVVWSVKTGQDSLQLLFERLGQYGFDMCKAKNIDFKTSILISHFNIPAENRYQLYLFCKEAINNAVKYSDAGLLELTAKEEGNLLEVNIADNGKGFDAETVKRGNGLNNMQQRANELGADFKLRSKRGGGCLISLKVKIT